MNAGNEADFELIVADLLPDEDDELDGPTEEEPGAMYRRAFARAEANVALERRRRAKAGLAAHNARERASQEAIAAAKAKLNRLNIANDDSGEKWMMAARSQSGDAASDEDVLAEALAELEARSD